MREFDLEYNIGKICYMGSVASGSGGSSTGDYNPAAPSAPVENPQVQLMKQFKGSASQAPRVSKTQSTKKQEAKKYSVDFARRQNKTPTVVTKEEALSGTQSLGASPSGIPTEGSPRYEAYIQALRWDALMTGMPGSITVLGEEPTLIDKSGITKLSDQIADMTDAEYVNYDNYVKAIEVEKYAAVKARAALNEKAEKNRVRAIEYIAKHPEYQSSQVDRFITGGKLSDEELAALPENRRKMIEFARQFSGIGELKLSGNTAPQGAAKAMSLSEKQIASMTDEELEEHINATTYAVSEASKIESHYGGGKSGETGTSVGSMGEVVGGAGKGDGMQTILESFRDAGLDQSQAIQALNAGNAAKTSLGAPVYLNGTIIAWSAPEGPAGGGVISRDGKVIGYEGLASLSPQAKKAAEISGYGGAWDTGRELSGAEVAAINAAREASKAEGGAGDALGGVALFNALTGAVYQANQAVQAAIDKRNSADTPAKREAAQAEVAKAEEAATALYRSNMGTAQSVLMGRTMDTPKTMTPEMVTKAMKLMGVLIPLGLAQFQLSGTNDNIFHISKEADSRFDPNNDNWSSWADFVANVNQTKTLADGRVVSDSRYGTPNDLAEAKVESSFPVGSKIVGEVDPEIGLKEEEAKALTFDVLSKDSKSLTADDKAILKIYNDHLSNVKRTLNPMGLAIAINRDISFNPTRYYGRGIGKLESGDIRTIDNIIPSILKSAQSQYTKAEAAVIDNINKIIANNSKGAIVDYVGVLSTLQTSPATLKMQEDNNAKIQGVVQDVATKIKAGTSLTKWEQYVFEQLLKTGIDNKLNIPALTKVLDEAVTLANTGHLDLAGAPKTLGLITTPVAGAKSAPVEAVETGSAFKSKNLNADNLNKANELWEVHYQIFANLLKKGININSLLRNDKIFNRATGFAIEGNDYGFVGRVFRGAVDENTDLTIPLTLDQAAKGLKLSPMSAPYSILKVGFQDGVPTFEINGVSQRLTKENAEPVYRLAKTIFDANPRDLNARVILDATRGSVLTTTGEFNTDGFVSQVIRDIKTYPNKYILSDLAVPPLPAAKPSVTTDGGATGAIVVIPNKVFATGIKVKDAIFGLSDQNSEALYNIGLELVKENPNDALEKQLVSLLRKTTDGKFNAIGYMAALTRDIQDYPLRYELIAKGFTTEPSATLEFTTQLDRDGQPIHPELGVGATLTKEELGEMMEQPELLSLFKTEPIKVSVQKHEPMLGMWTAEGEFYPKTVKAGNSDDIGGPKGAGEGAFFVGEGTIKGKGASPDTTVKAEYFVGKNADGSIGRIWWREPDGRWREGQYEYLPDQKTVTKIVCEGMGCQLREDDLNVGVKYLLDKGFVSVGKDKTDTATDTTPKLTQLPATGEDAEYIGVDIKFGDKIIKSGQILSRKDLDLLGVSTVNIGTDGKLSTFSWKSRDGKSYSLTYNNLSNEIVSWSDGTGKTGEGNFQTGTAARWRESQLMPVNNEADIIKQILRGNPVPYVINDPSEYKGSPDKPTYFWRPFKSPNDTSLSLAKPMGAFDNTIVADRKNKLVYVGGFSDTPDIPDRSPDNKNIEHAQLANLIDKSIGTGQIFAIDVSGKSWCSPCNAFSPTVEELASSNNNDSVRYFYLTVDDMNDSRKDYFQTMELLGKYGVAVDSLPTMVYIQDGKQVGKPLSQSFVSMSKDDYIKSVNNFISSGSIPSSSSVSSIPTYMIRRPTVITDVLDMSDLKAPKLISKYSDPNRVVVVSIVQDYDPEGINASQDTYLTSLANKKGGDNNQRFDVFEFSIDNKDNRAIDLADWANMDSTPYNLVFKGGVYVGTLSSLLGLGEDSARLNIILDNAGIKDYVPTIPAPPFQLPTISTVGTTAKFPVVFKAPSYIKKGIDDIKYIGYSDKGELGIGLVYNGDTYTIERIGNNWQFCSGGVCHSSEQTSTLEQTMAKIHSNDYSIDSMNKAAKASSGGDTPYYRNSPIDSYIKDYNMKPVTEVVYSDTKAEPVVADVTPVPPPTPTPPAPVTPSVVSPPFDIGKAAGDIWASIASGAGKIQVPKAEFPKDAESFGLAVGLTTQQAVEKLASEFMTIYNDQRKWDEFVGNTAFITPMFHIALLGIKGNIDKRLAVDELMKKVGDNPELRAIADRIKEKATTDSAKVVNEYIKNYQQAVLDYYLGKPRTARGTDEIDLRAKEQQVFDEAIKSGISEIEAHKKAADETAQVIAFGETNEGIYQNNINTGGIIGAIKQGISDQYLLTKGYTKEQVDNAKTFVQKYPDAFNLENKPILRSAIKAGANKDFLINIGFNPDVVDEEVSVSTLGDKEYFEYSQTRKGLKGDDKGVYIGTESDGRIISMPQRDYDSLPQEQKDILNKDGYQGWKTKINEWTKVFTDKGWVRPDGTFALDIAIGHLVANKPVSEMDERERAEVMRMGFGMPLSREGRQKSLADYNQTKEAVNGLFSNNSRVYLMNEATNMDTPEKRDKYYKALGDVAKTTWEAMTPWDEGIGQKPTFGGITQMAGEAFVPFVALATTWGALSAGERALYGSLDALSLVPVAGAGIRTVSTLRRAGFTAGEALRRGALSVASGGVYSVVHPFQTMKAPLSWLKEAFDANHVPEEIVIKGVLGSRGHDVKALINVAGGGAALDAGNALTFALARGETPIVLNGLEALQLSDSGLIGLFNKYGYNTGAIRFHAEPAGENILKSIDIKELFKLTDAQKSRLADIELRTPAADMRDIKWEFIKEIVEDRLGKSTDLKKRIEALEILPTTRKTADVQKEIAQLKTTLKYAEDVETNRGIGSFEILDKGREPSLYSTTGGGSLFVRGSAQGVRGEVPMLMMITGKGFTEVPEDIARLRDPDLIQAEMVKLAKAGKLKDIATGSTKNFHIWQELESQDWYYGELVPVPSGKTEKVSWIVPEENLMKQSTDLRIKAQTIAKQIEGETVKGTLTDEKLKGLNELMAKALNESKDYYDKAIKKGTKDSAVIDADHIKYIDQMSGKTSFVVNFTTPDNLPTAQKIFGNPALIADMKAKGFKNIPKDIFAKAIKTVNLKPEQLHEMIADRLMDSEKSRFWAGMNMNKQISPIYVDDADIEDALRTTFKGMNPVLPISDLAIDDIEYYLSNIDHRVYGSTASLAQNPFQRLYGKPSGDLDIAVENPKEVAEKFAELINARSGSPRAKAVPTKDAGGLGWGVEIDGELKVEAKNLAGHLKTSKLGFERDLEPVYHNGVRYESLGVQVGNKLNTVLLPGYGIPVKYTDIVPAGMYGRVSVGPYAAGLPNRLKDIDRLYLDSLWLIQKAQDRGEVWADEALTNFRILMGEETGMIALSPRDQLGVLLTGTPSLPPSAKSTIGKPKPPIGGKASPSMLANFRAELTGESKTYNNIEDVLKGLSPAQEGYVRVAHAGDDTGARGILDEGLHFFNGIDNSVNIVTGDMGKDVKAISRYFTKDPARYNLSIFDIPKEEYQKYLSDAKLTNVEKAVMRRQALDAVKRLESKGDFQFDTFYDSIMEWVGETGIPLEKALDEYVIGTVPSKYLVGQVENKGGKALVYRSATFKTLNVDKGVGSLELPQYSKGGTPQQTESLIKLGTSISTIGQDIKNNIENYVRAIGGSVDKQAETIFRKVAKMYGYSDDVVLKEITKNRVPFAVGEYHPYKDFIALISGDAKYKLEDAFDTITHEFNHRYMSINYGADTVREGMGKLYIMPPDEYKTYFKGAFGRDPSPQEIDGFNQYSKVVDDINEVVGKVIDTYQRTHKRSAEELGIGDNIRKYLVERPNMLVQEKRTGFKNEGYFKNLAKNVERIGIKGNYPELEKELDGIVRKFVDSIPSPNKVFASKVYKELLADGSIVRYVKLNNLLGTVIENPTTEIGIAEDILGKPVYKPSVMAEARGKSLSAVKRGEISDVHLQIADSAGLSESEFIDFIKNESKNELTVPEQRTWGGKYRAYQQEGRLKLVEKGAIRRMERQELERLYKEMPQQRASLAAARVISGAIHNVARIGELEARMGVPYREPSLTRTDRESARTEPRVGGTPTRIPSDTDRIRTGREPVRGEGVRSERPPRTEPPPRLPDIPRVEPQPRLEGRIPTTGRGGGTVTGSGRGGGGVIVTKDRRSWDELSQELKQTALVWKQGWWHWALPKPYRTIDLIGSPKPFAGTKVYHGPKAAYKSVARVQGAQLPDRIDIDLGIMDLTFLRDKDGKDVKVYYHADPKQATTGQGPSNIPQPQLKRRHGGTITTTRITATK